MAAVQVVEVATTAVQQQDVAEWLAANPGPLAVQFSTKPGSQSVRIYSAEAVFTAADLDSAAAVFAAAAAAGRKLWSEDAALLDRTHEATLAALGNPRIYCARTVDRCLAPAKQKGELAPGRALVTLMQAHLAAPKRHRVIAMQLEDDDRMWRDVARRGYRVDAWALADERAFHTRVIEQFGRSVDGVEVRSVRAGVRNAFAENERRDDLKAAWLVERGIRFDRSTGAKWAEPSRLDVSAMTGSEADWDRYDAAYRSMHRLDPLNSLARRVGEDGLVHPLIRVNQAVTGRLSISEPGIQNLPHKRQSVRHVIKTNEGYTSFVSVDHSNAELRVLARWIGDASFTQRVLDADLYQEVADYSELPRGDAKWMTIAFMYAMQKRTLAKEIGIEKAELVHEALHAVVPEIPEFIAEMEERARRGERFETLYGRPLPVLDGKGFETRFALATNLVVQGSARDAWGYGVRAAAESLGEDTMSIPLHDELFVLAPAGRADEYAEKLLEAMTVDLGGGIVLNGKVAISKGRWAARNS